MKTIKWLVSLVPKQSRALVACLLIAIMTLATVVVRQDRKITDNQITHEKTIQQVSQSFNRRLDSAYQVISIVKDSSKREILNGLERIIAEQKKMIEDQKKQSKSKQVTKKPLIEGKYK